MFPVESTFALARSNSQIKVAKGTLQFLTIVLLSQIPFNQNLLELHKK